MVSFVVREVASVYIERKTADEIYETWHGRLLLLSTGGVSLTLESLTIRVQLSL